MSRAMLAAVALVGIVCMAGCAGQSVGMGGACPGFIFGNINYPTTETVATSQTQFQLDRSDFTIVGPVTARASSMNVLGIVGVGDSGYNQLYDAAVDRGADAVIDIKMDRKLLNVLFFYTKSTTILTGTAIKWNK